MSIYPAPSIQIKLRPLTLINNITSILDQFLKLILHAVCIGVFVQKPAFILILAINHVLYICRNGSVTLAVLNKARSYSEDLFWSKRAFQKTSKASILNGL